MSLGSGEIFIIVILALLLFGPDKLPELARQSARLMRDLRRAADDVKSQFNLLGDDDDDEPRRTLPKMREKLNEEKLVDSSADEPLLDETSTRDPKPLDENYDVIDGDDTYFINNADGDAPDDNDWRRCEEDATLRAQEPMGEPWTPKPLEKSRLDSTRNSDAQSSGDNDTNTIANELELRVTPTTSVARSSAPTLVRKDDVEPNEPKA